MKRLYSEPCGLTWQWRDRLTCEGKYPFTPAAWAVQLISTGPSWQCYPSACWLAPIFPSSLSTVSIFPSICEVYLLQLLSQTSTSEPWLVDFLPKSWPRWSSDVWVQLSWVRFLSRLCHLLDNLTKVSHCHVSQQSTSNTQWALLPKSGQAQHHWGGGCILQLTQLEDCEVSYKECARIYISMSIKENE